MIKLFKKIARDRFPAFMKAGRYSLLFFLQVFHFCGFSQKQHFRFEQVGINAGISESNVLCILQDSRGLMWFGTGEGLAKYDGYSFTFYKYDKKNQQSIGNNIIQAIAESKNGDLWIGTSGGGLCLYDRRKDNFTRFQNSINNINSITADDISSVIEDSKGNVWIGTLNGLDKFDPRKKVFTHYRYNEHDSNSLSDNYIRYVLEDSHRDVWVATMNGGLNLFNSNTQSFTRFQHTKGNNNSLSSNNVFTIFEDSKKRLWIGTNENGLDLFNKEKKLFSHFKNVEGDRYSLSSNSVRAIEESNDHKIWIATENAGISILDPEKRVFQVYTYQEHDKSSLASSSINAIQKDTKGNMWIGTFNAGVILADIDAGQFRHYQHIPTVNSLSNNKVLCFYEDSKRKIWIGTDGGGLNLFDPLTGHFSYFRHEKNNKNSICGDYVLNVCEDSKGNIWIGTWGDGITVYNPITNTFKHFKNDLYNPASLSSNNAWKIIEDKEKNIWVGTYGGGINKFDPSTNSFTNYQYDEKNLGGITDSWINSLYDDSEGNLWIGTSGGGLNRFDKKKNTFISFLHQDSINSISHNNVNSIWEDKNKNLWIGTLSGLNLLDRKTKKFSVFTTEDGLPGNSIFGVLEDREGQLWISTDKGISCFNPANKSFKNFGAADGLQSDKFKEQAFCKSSSGMMYFGGNNGFNLFYPATIKTTPFDPPLVITNFQIFSKEVPVAINKNDRSPLQESITETKSIVLSYKHSFFSFAFASLNYSIADKKKYAYMLVGFDKTWNEVGNQRTATYTNLDPGKYVFKVRGLNNEGQWSPSVTSIDVIITPPFWLTWWFRISGLVLISVIVIAFYRVRVNAIRKRREVLEQKVKEQTIQLELLNEEERKARHEADRANIELEKKNIELEQFVYIASHDLREPLRTTTSFVELFQKQYKGKLDQKADSYLTYITGATERMRTLINDLLDYSRIGTNKEMEQVACNVIIQEVLSDLGIALKEAGAGITTGYLPVISGHRTAIKQLFQNLVANGVKFRKKDLAPTINISAEEKNGLWKFSFTDNGIGIEKKDSDKIFVIFQRLHTRKEYEGSGIGLSHCKKIVELHKGSIWVDSTPGEGSTFCFTLPAGESIDNTLLPYDTRTALPVAG